MREEGLEGRCNSLKLTLNVGDNSAFQEILDEGMKFVYGKCANCNIRFYHQMKCADDLLKNFGKKYDTRGMKILGLLELLFKDCKEIKRKKFFGTLQGHKIC